jgi:hypothetical protein
MNWADYVGVVGGWICVAGVVARLFVATLKHL